MSGRPPRLAPVPPFKIQADHVPTGDQPEAIDRLTEGLEAGEDRLTLLGATGTGKTFTIANVIERVQRPTLVIAPNKSLAAQLANEFREVFPEQRDRVLRQLLRLLPTRGIRPADRHLHREGLLGERRDRPPAALGDQRAAHARGRAHRRQRLLHLRPGFARGIHGSDPARAQGRAVRPGLRDPAPGRYPVRAQQREPVARQVPRAGRHARGASRLRGDGRAHRVLGRRHRTDHALRHGDRRDAHRAARGHDLPRNALRGVGRAI